MVSKSEMAKNLVAFTGGGWNAMSGHSGWIASALSSGNRISSQSLSLDQLFADTETASGNSGGSWFLSALAYSPEFASDLSNNPDDWFTTGYFGQQRSIFAQAPGRIDWGELVSNAVDKITPEIINEFTDDLYIAYGSSNPFSGLNDFVSSIRNLNVDGSSTLADNVEAKLKQIGKNVVDYISLSIGLKPWLNQIIEGASNIILGKDLYASISSLIIDPIQNGEGLLNWYQDVQNTAFKSYKLAERLGKIAEEVDKLSWAGGKNLLFPITVSGFPIAIDKNSDSFLQSSLSVSKDSLLPRNENYLIPVTAKVDPTNKSTLVFPEESLDFKSYILPQVSGISNPLQTKAITFPLQSNLTLLETVSASGSFGGFAATSQALDNVITNLLKTASLENLKSNISATIDQHKSLIKDGIESVGDLFFNSLKKSTNTGDWFVDAANAVWNAPIEAVQFTFDGLVGAIPPSIFNEALQAISNLAIDTVILLVNNGPKLATPAYTMLADLTKDLALPVNLNNQQISFLNSDQQTDFSSSTPLRIFDGGYTDNTGVLSTLAQWQEDYPTDKFTVNAFINSTATVALGAKEKGSSLKGAVPVDFAKLFGKDGTKKDDSLVQNFPLSLSGGENPNAPSIAAIYPYVFDGGVWDDSSQNAPVWQYQVSDDFGIAYYQFDVTTVDNPAWGIEAGHSGTINAFTTYNTNSAAGPTSNNAWSEYEKNYDLITEGVLDHGGYRHLLKAFGLLDITWDSEMGRIFFNGDQGFHADYVLTMKQIGNLIDSYVACDVYSYSGETKQFIGTIGGERTENGVDFSGTNYDYFRFKQGSSIGFELRSAGSDVSELNLNLEIKEHENGHLLYLTDSQTNNLFLTLGAEIVTSFDDSTENSKDMTPRHSAHDTYIGLIEGSEWTVNAISSGSYFNQFSIIKVDVDPITGAMTIDGHATDTEEFDLAARAAFAANTVFTSKTLNPYSTNDFSFTAKETSFYAPALLTQEDRLYVGNHDFVENHSHSHMVGEREFGFEDQFHTASDFDHNDALITFIASTTTI